jgi:hypothetical protein
VNDPRIPQDGQQFYIRVRGRILGPFNLEKLRSLRTRGQFSRAHEVSTDRRTWSPATSIDSLQSPTTPSGSAGQGTSQGAGDPVGVQASGTRAVPKSGDAAGWYYRVNEQQFGPATTLELQALIQSDRIKPSDFAWREGLPAWVPVRDIPGLAGGAAGTSMMTGSPGGSPKRRGRRTSAAIYLSLGIAVLCGSAIYFKLPQKLGIRVPSLSDLASVINSGVLTSIEGEDAERRLADCVGLVVTGIRATLRDGSVVEEAYGTGTCFAIDREGHALTNKHVVTEVQKITRARLLREKIE